MLHNIRFLYIRLGELNASNNMCCFALAIGRIVYNCKSLYAHQINDVKEEDVKNLKKSKKIKKNYTKEWEGKKSRRGTIHIPRSFNDVNFIFYLSFYFCYYILRHQILSGWSLSRNDGYYGMNFLFKEDCMLWLSQEKTKYILWYMKFISLCQFLC